MAVEARRGCGYRKAGGLYLVASGMGSPCHRLPIPLIVCPCCGAGIKQTRGWTWVDPNGLFQGNCELLTEAEKQLASPVVGYCNVCPVCRPALFSYEIEKGGKKAMEHRAGLLWIGGQFYKNSNQFMDEVRSMGISRRIKAVPRDFVLGKTWVLLAHPKAYYDDNEQRDRAGVFYVFRPERIEKVLTKSMATDEELAKLAEQGITPVVVPDDDKDHRGTVYDKGDEELDAETEPEAATA